jgi:cation diffusion facilitator family transporter
MSHDGGTRAVITALAANLAIAATKFLAFLLTGASSMLAESIHSVADSSNQTLLLIGGQRARRRPTPEHPFGYGRVRYVYAFLVAIVLFTLGGLFALWEAWHKLTDPHPIDSWHWVPVLVLVVALILEGFALRTAVREARAVKGGASWVQFIRRARAPELPVILLEDFGALVGLLFALIGVGLTLLTGNGIWDGLGTAAIGLLLVAIALVLAAETKSLLIGEGATIAHQKAIREALLGGTKVESLIHVKTLHLGPDELLVAAKIGVRPTESAQDVARAINEAETRIRAAVPIARVIYLEPDIRRPQAEQSQAGQSMG